ncbi:phage tail protein [Shewanella surugensis]|uniref:Phage tail protein n=1 Tax=Shewanella surugensis TaxID=212020 RepID=A0ABT0L6I9_9GAMM|nr:phage tail protein [Shewanella surugensis]MCL1123307.1 phage tail protein [Shewanella surugensis]
MSKLTELTGYLMEANYKGHKLAHASQFDSWIEGGSIDPASKRINGTGLLVARFTYAGVISINPCAAPAALICTYISFWVQQNTGKYDAKKIEFSADINDDNSSDIEITIEDFQENIELIEQADGPFLFGDKHYDFGEQSMWIAEAFLLESQVLEPQVKAGT